MYLDAMTVEPHFGEAVRLAHSSIADVCRAFETIKRRNKPGKVATNEGHLHIKRGGWLTSDDLSNLYETCKLGRHGLPSEPVTNGVELSLEQARSLVRQLLDRWAEELANSESQTMRNHTAMTVDEFAKALAALLVQAKEAGLEKAELIALLRQQADAMQQRIDG